jgi:hypothetical protein
MKSGIKIFIILLAAAICSCSSSLTKPEEVIGQDVQTHLDFLSTYIIKKPTEISDSAWFSDSLTKYKISRLGDYDVAYEYASKSHDTIHYIISRKELGRDFENYRLLGGSYVGGSKPQFIEEKFISIRYNKEDFPKVLPTLIQYLNVDDVLSFQKAKSDTLIQWPEKGVFYDKQTHKWELGAANEFYFLKKMRDSIEAIKK